jgi:hypothetical protein
MSVGGAFRIQNNVGLVDDLLMARSKLNTVLRTIGARRLATMRSLPENAGKPDKLLMDTDNSWMPTLDEVEKTHIVFVNSTFKPFVSLSSEYSKTAPIGGNPKLGNVLRFTLPILGAFVNDCMIYIKLDNFRALDPRDKVRYPEFLGHRLFKSTTFLVNNVPLETYGPEKYNIHWQFKVPPGKEEGYLRNIGQEVPKQGFLTADPAIDEVREYRYFGHGPQTFKTTQTSVELQIPLLTWFKDIQTSLPNFLFPYGSAVIEIELEDEANLVSYANYSNNTGQIYTPPVITDSALFCNHIFLTPEILKIFVSKFNFQLIRVTCSQRIKQLKESHGRILLNKMRFPVETLYVAFRPTVNTADTQRWHRNTVITKHFVHEAVVIDGTDIQSNTATFLDEVPVVRSLALHAHDVVLFPANRAEFYNSYLTYRFGPNHKTPRDVGWNLFPFSLNPGEYQPSGHFNASQERELYLVYESDVDPIHNVPYIGTNVQLRGALDGVDPLTNPTPDAYTSPVEFLAVAESINFLLTVDNGAVLRYAT